MSKQQLLSPDLIKVKAPGGGHYMGGSQQWFCDSWKRMSGCGPTTAAGMLWYLTRSRRNNSLCEIGEADKAGFLKLMDTVFDYITPGLTGVSSTSVFTDGMIRYGASRGVRLQTRTLNAPPAIYKRPPQETLIDFILESLRRDFPVAFLNLSNGALCNLNSWHWVMIIELNPESMLATICDNGGTREICLGEWFETTALGGGFASIYL